MIWKEAGEKYIGQWEDNIQNGIGMHIWYETSNQSKYLRNRYIGCWKNGCREGYGVFFYSTGAKYEGYWVKDSKCGHGQYTFINGTMYTGKFLNNQMAEYNEHGIFPLDSSQNTGDYRRDLSRSPNLNNNVNTKISGKLKPIKVRFKIKYV